MLLYFIFIVCFIAGFIVCQVMKRNDEKRVILNEVEIIEVAKKEAEKELIKIKEKLGKGTKEKGRDEIIHSVDDYFDKYYPDGYSG